MLSLTGVYYPGDGTDGYNAGDFAINGAVETAQMGVILANYKGAEDSVDTYFSAGYKFTGVENMTFYAGYEYGKSSEQNNIDGVVTYFMDTVTVQAAVMYNRTDSQAYVEGALEYDLESGKLIAVAGYDQDGATGNVSSSDEYMVGLEGYYNIDSVSLMSGVYYYDESGVEVPFNVQVSF